MPWSVAQRGSAGPSRIREDSRRAKYGGKTSWREMAGRKMPRSASRLLALDLSLDT
jgi:hypothetical protein